MLKLMTISLVPPSLLPTYLCTIETTNFALCLNVSYLWIKPCNFFSASLWLCTLAYFFSLFFSDLLYTCNLLSISRVQRTVIYLISFPSFEKKKNSIDISYISLNNFISISDLLYACSRDRVK